MNHNEDVKLIHKFITGELSPSEEDQYNIWKEKDPVNTKLEEQIESIWKAAAQAPQTFFDAEGAFQKHLEKINKEEVSLLERTENTGNNAKIITLNKSYTNTYNLSWFKVLAAVFVLGIAALFLFRSQGDITIAETDTVLTLSDDSKVWLKAGSEINLNSFSPNNRNVMLKGLAYFDVKSNNEAPFKITSRDFIVQVLGTKFLVNVDEKEVMVKEGKVKVSNDLENAILIANQKAILNNDKVIVENVAFDEKELWFNEKLKFNKTPFDQVIKEISASYNVKFILPVKNDWSNCPFTSGSLEGNSLDQVLVILKLTYDLEYTRMKDNSINLSKVKCK